MICKIQMLFINLNIFKQFKRNQQFNIMLLQQLNMIKNTNKGISKTGKKETKQIDKNLQINEEDLILEMMIKEARQREQIQARNNMICKGVIKLEESSQNYQQTEIKQKILTKIQVKNKKSLTMKKHIYDIKIKGQLNNKKGIKKGIIYKSNLNQTKLNKNFQVNNIYRYKDKMQPQKQCNLIQTTLDMYLKQFGKKQSFGK